MLQNFNIKYLHKKLSESNKILENCYQFLNDKQLLTEWMLNLQTNKPTKS